MEYTDRQIYDMLLPKLKKNFPYLDWSERTETTSSFPDLVKMIALVYRSGYVRGEKGRSFIIGEKKEDEWVVVDKEIEAKDTVRMKSNQLHKLNPDFYPPKSIVGKVIKVNKCDCLVEWPKNSTSGDDRWFAMKDDLEVVVCK